MMHPRQALLRIPWQVEWPVLLVLVSWLALWCLWPSSSAGTRALQPQRLPTRFSLVVMQAGELESVLDPRRIALPSLGHTVLEGIEVVPWRKKDAPAGFLMRGRSDDVRPSLTEPSLASRARSALRGYTPTIRHASVFGTKLKHESPIWVEISDELKKCAYEIGSPAREKMLTRKKPWTVRAYITINASGRVTNVMLEAPSDDAVVNRAVVNMLYRGASRRTGIASFGRVRVNFEPL